ncbi:MAG: hypothetical protein Q8R47_06545 [Nanoarchaeota archaeon]|nr:hypothetical protein [Nanoarchaeota archaeon]
MISQQLNQPSEPPLYSAYESKARALIPKTIWLLFLAFIFYLGVLINISLLELDATQETGLKTGALLILAVLIIVGMVLTFRKTSQPYLFYKNRITHGKETLYYVNIDDTSPHTDFIDKMFKTYFIQLGKTFALRHIPENIPLSNYVQQLIAFAKKNQ